MTPREIKTLSALVEIVGEYRQKVMTGRLTGDLIVGDCDPYMDGLRLIHEHGLQTEQRIVLLREALDQLKTAIDTNWKHGNLQKAANFIETVLHIGELDQS